MFSFLCKNRIPMDPKMREYCIKSTNDSIRKMTEKYNEERKSNKIKFDNLVITANDDPPNDNFIIISIICFLSSTTLFYYFYKASR
jgi:hypothetical protein